MKKFKVLLIYPNLMMSTLLPLSISILSAVLKENRYDVELFDTTYYRTEEISSEKQREYLLQIKPFKELEYKGSREDCFNDLKKMVNDYKPNLIGISLVEDTIPFGLELLEAIKDYDVPVIAGGVGTAFNYTNILNSGLVDCCCIGEGEKTIIELCKTLENNGDWSILNNITMLSLDGDQVVRLWRNKLNELTDINKLPYPDFDIFGKDRIKRVMHGKTFKMLHVEVDRGCPYECSYCCAAALKRLQGNGYYRRKSNERIIAEMIYLKKKYKPDYFNFSSETFLARPLGELKELLHDYSIKIAISYWCQSRPETISEDKVKALKGSGCADFQLGIEHGNEKFRKRWLNRSNTNKQISEACSLLEKYKIPYTVNNIIGFPDETRELIFDTIELNRRINPKTYNCFMMNPYKGTEMYKYCIKKGLMPRDTPSKQLLLGKDIKYKYLTKEELIGLQRTFPLYVKFDKNLYDMIKIAEEDSVVGNASFNALRSIYIEKHFGD